MSKAKRRQVVVDPEFKRIIPALTDQEKADLEASIVTEGCRDALVIWPWKGKRILVDGHHRLEICERLGARYDTVNRAFADRDVAVDWIARNQLSRRNMTPDQVTLMFVRLCEFKRGEAKGHLSKAGKQFGRGQQPFSKTKKAIAPIHFNKEVAKAAKAAGEARVTASRVAAVQTVVTKGTMRQKAAMQSGEIASGKLAKEIRETNRTKKKAAETKARVAAARRPSRDQGVKLGDFRDISKSIKADSVDLIFTDPPYNRKTLPLYADLAEVSARVLKPGGSLITYVGQYVLPEAIELLSKHLRWWWVIACQHTGKRRARMREYGVVVQWKPMLWFVKGTRGDKQTFLDDLVASEMEKDTHEWQQGVVEAQYYVDKLTPDGGLVFDPFCGGGTTAVAAKRLWMDRKIRWLTCDVDEDSVTLARERIHDADNARS